MLLSSSAGQRCMIHHQFTGNIIRCYATTDKGQPSGEPTAGPSESIPSFLRSSNIDADESKEEELPAPWEDPWLHVLGKHRQKLKQDYPKYAESANEFRHVERLFPPKLIPEPPPCKDYPTPSGWRPPKCKWAVVYRGGRWNEKYLSLIGKGCTQIKRGGERCAKNKKNASKYDDTKI